MKEWQCNGGDGCFVTEPCRCTMPDDMEPEACLLSGIAEWGLAVSPGHSAEQATVVTTGCVRCDFLRTFFRKDNMLCEVHRE